MRSGNAVTGAAAAAAANPSAEPSNAVNENRMQFRDPDSSFTSQPARSVGRLVHRQTNFAAFLSNEMEQLSQPFFRSAGQGQKRSRSSSFLTSLFPSLVLADFDSTSHSNSGKRGTQADGVLWLAGGRTHGRRNERRRMRPVLVLRPSRRLSSRRLLSHLSTCRRMSPAEPSRAEIGTRPRKARVRKIRNQHIFVFSLRASRVHSTMDLISISRSVARPRPEVLRPSTQKPREILLFPLAGRSGGRETSAGRAVVDEGNDHRRHFLGFSEKSQRFEFFVAAAAAAPSPRRPETRTGTNGKSERRRWRRRRTTATLSLVSTSEYSDLMHACSRQEKHVVRRAAP